MGRQSKKFKIKAREIPRNAAYLAVREIPRKKRNADIGLFTKPSILGFDKIDNFLDIGNLNNIIDFNPFDGPFRADQDIGPV